MPREEAGKAYDALLEAEANRAKASASAAVGALSNHESQTNAAAIGPNAQVTFISGPITPKVSGKFLVIAQASVVDATVDDPVEFQIIRDPTPGATTGNPGGTAVGGIAESDSGHVVGDAHGAVAWVDTAGGPPFAAHTYGITAFSPGGHALTLAIDRCSINIIELPG